MLVRNQLKRLCLIDRAIRTLQQPTKERIIEYVSEEFIGETTDRGISESTFEKDIMRLREEFDAPLIFQYFDVYTRGEAKGYYRYSDKGYEFWKSFLWHYSLWMILPNDITERIEPIIS